MVATATSHAVKAEKHVVRAPRLKIGFVMHKMQVAGAEVLVAEIIRRLRDEITPTILCLDGVGELGEQLQDEGVEVLNLERRPGIDRSAPGRIRDITDRRGLQVLHAHQYTPFFYSALACRLAKRPLRLVFTEHGRHYPDVVGWKRRLANRFWLARKADATTACCEFAADAVRRKDGFSQNSVLVVPNGIDIDRFRLPESVEERKAMRASIGLDDNLKYVVTPARFHPVKDHATLVQAFARVVAARDDARLLLLGDGEERPAVERLVTELGIASRVHFLGVRNDVEKFLAAADVFALSSLSEAASVTILEAMACQRPVVATRVGGTPELVRDGVDGLLTPRQDSEGLAQSLLRLLSDDALAEKMGRSGRERVLERFRLDQAVDAYLGIYRQLVKV